MLNCFAASGSSVELAVELESVCVRMLARVSLRNQSRTRQRRRSELRQQINGSQVNSFSISNFLSLSLERCGRTSTPVAQHRTRLRCCRPISAADSDAESRAHTSTLTLASYLLRFGRTLASSNYRRVCIAFFLCNFDSIKESCVCVCEK